MGTKTLTLGPFLIQEGCWDIKINFPNCTFIEKVCPPEYSSGCSEFVGVKISNIQCIPGTTDTWSFDIFIPGSGTFKIDGAGIYSYNTTYTINAGNIQGSCKTINLIGSIMDCMAELTICPPKPCSVSDCDFEVYPGDIICDPNVEGNFAVQLHIINPLNQNLCYRIPPATGSGFSLASGMIPNLSGDTQLMIFDCNNLDCYKMIYIPNLDCDELGEHVLSGRRLEDSSVVKVVPNPFNKDEVTIYSELEFTSFQIYDVGGKKIIEGQFHGSFYQVTIPGSSGMYLLRYSDTNGISKYIKLIKI